MKKIIYMCAVAAILAACAPTLPENQFRLKGSISVADGNEIYLVYSLGETLVRDTTIIVNGTFEFSGVLDAPMIVSTLYMGNDRDWRNRNRRQVYLEPTEMAVTLDQNFPFEESPITGSNTQIEADTLKKHQRNINNQIKDINTQIRHESDETARKALREQVDILKIQRNQLDLKFLKTHPNSLLAPIQLRIMMPHMAYQEIREIFDNFTDRVKQYGDVKSITEELEKLEKLIPGAPAPNIRKMDVNGNEISISNLKGKVILLDFWASWCVPCRKSFPHVKALFEKYNDKGFEVFCVADNDNQPDAWKKAIKEYGTEKFYHVLRRLYSNENINGKQQHNFDAINLYAVHFLPTKYLIGRDGRIIGKMNDDELDAKLKEIFAF